MPIRSLENKGPHRFAPAWAHAELDRAAKTAQTGDLVFEVESGRIKKVRRQEIVAPLRDAAGAEDADDLVLPLGLRCPDSTCDGPLAELDYGTKVKCAECQTTYSVYELRNRGLLK